MKRTILIVSIALASVLLSSCSMGSGCPGGGGYSQHSEAELPSQA